MRTEARIIVNNYYSEEDKKLFCKFAKIIKKTIKTKKHNDKYGSMIKKLVALVDIQHH